MKWVVFFLLIAGLWSCGASGNSTKKNKEQAVVSTSLDLEKMPGENRIVFLTLRVWLQDSVKDEYGFAQQSVQYADGKIKTTAVMPGYLEPYQLYWELRDKNGQVLEVGNTPDPLFRSYETSDEYSGAMEKNLVLSKSGEMLIRFNLNDHTQVLSVHKLSNGKLKKLYEAKLL